MKVNYFTQLEVCGKFHETEVKNALVEKIDLNVIGHFGNAVTLDIPINIDDCLYSNPFSSISSTLNCGVLIQALFNVLDLNEDNGISISGLKKIPCRVIVSDNKTVAIGNFMKNKFIVFEDLLKSFNEKFNK